MLWKDFVLLLHRKAADRSCDALRDRLADNPTPTSVISEPHVERLEMLDAKFEREDARFKLWLERAKELYL